MSSLQEQLAKLQGSTTASTNDEAEGTFGKVREILVKVTSAETESIGPSTSLRDELSVSSLDVVEIAVRVETTFGIRVDHSSGFQEFTSVQDIVDFVDNNVAD